MEADLPDVYEDTTNPPTSVDPERIWLEPWDETGHRIWDDDPTTWGGDGVEYVRADIAVAELAQVQGELEEARRTIESNEDEFLYQDSLRIDLRARIASLERELEDFRIAASNVIFDHDAGGPCTPDTCAPVCAFRDLRSLLPGYEEYRDKWNGEDADMDQRPRPSAALASHSVEEDPDDA